MLSIIICSIKPNLLVDVQQNISETLCIDHEIVAIENHANVHSLARAYNIGAAKAKYAYLLFLHEDVAFHTQGWGKMLVNLLQQTQIGLVGISGAVYKSQYPSTWSMIPEEYYRINALQRWKDGRITQHIRKESLEAEYSPVAAIDGVFMAMRKEVWQQYKFNEEHLHGFHLYDTDTSLRIGQKFLVVVSHQILLEHFSEGTLNADWINESIKFHKRYRKQLPVFTVGLVSKQVKRINYHALSSFVFVLIRNEKFKLALIYYLKTLKLVIFRKTNVDIVKFLLKSVILWFRKS
jgi:hypothetical protein